MGRNSVFEHRGGALPRRRHLCNGHFLSLSSHTVLTITDIDSIGFPVRAVISIPTVRLRHLGRAYRVSALSRHEKQPAGTQLMLYRTPLICHAFPLRRSAEAHTRCRKQQAQLPDQHINTSFVICSGEIIPLRVYQTRADCVIQQVLQEWFRTSRGGRGIPSPWRGGSGGCGRHGRFGNYARESARGRGRKGGSAFRRGG